MGCHPCTHDTPPVLGLSRSERGDRWQVPALTPRMLVELHGLSRIDLLKLDIEGGERLILKALSELDIGCIHMECHFEGCLQTAKIAWEGKWELVSTSEFGTVQDDSLWCTPLK
mmetsp:Transcript_50287/g.109308  ORF Transcript_50287/g.109308 Transcript_50287/m.109308 type:complete len:114 (-) Transcript_50287:16-357(-)